MTESIEHNSRVIEKATAKQNHTMTQFEATREALKDNYWKTLKKLRKEQDEKLKQLYQEEKNLREKQETANNNMLKRKEL